MAVFLLSCRWLISRGSISTAWVISQGICLIKCQMKDKVRILTVYSALPIKKLGFFTMDTVRWLKVSEALARQGFSVDMLAGGIKRRKEISCGVNMIPFSDVKFNEYHIVKTLFHEGFETLMRLKGDRHPFIISKLGSVVAGRKTCGVYFDSVTRRYLFSIQKRISRASRYVSILTEESINLWLTEFGNKQKILQVPTAVDRVIPRRGPNPYARYKEKIALFAANIYGKDAAGKNAQKDLNIIFQRRLNNIGWLLKKKGIRLCLVVSGDTELLDNNCVTNFGKIDNSRIWDYQYYAHAGLVLAQGKHQHNESSKIYYYLRTALPVISESPVPNNDLILDSGCGYIAGFGDDNLIADLTAKAINRKWDKPSVVRYILNNHTWDKRIEVYKSIIEKNF